MHGECIVCGARSFEQLYRGLCRCSACDFVFAEQSLTVSEVRGLYTESYFRGGEYENYPGDRQCIERNFTARLHALRPFLQPRRHARLLEIGSAYGFFLDLARKEFQTVQGIDVTEAGTRFANEGLGLDVQTGEFLEHDFGPTRFDVVCLWDTIEHLRSPHLYMRKVAACTDPGALLAITTGDIGSLNARIRRGSWRLIHPPTHLQYFSKATLSRMLTRLGFDVVYSESCGFWRSARFAAHSVVVGRYRQPHLFRLLERTGLLGFKFYVNLFDIMYVIARRR